MKLIPISAGNFHCDGGALFGVIPKKLWSKVYPADENNFTKLALRCFLVDLEERKILIETGIGNHFPDKYFENNGYNPGSHLEESLLENSYSVQEISDVFFTHLHWDHCTGAVKSENGKMDPVFPNAKYWCSKSQWEHSKISNIREKAAYNTDFLNFLYQYQIPNLQDSQISFPHPNSTIHFLIIFRLHQKKTYILKEGKTDTCFPVRKVICGKYFLMEYPGFYRL